MCFIDDDEFEFDGVTPEELEKLEAEMEFEANLNFDEDSDPEMELETNLDFNEDFEPDDCFYEGETPAREEMIQKMNDEEWAHELDENSTNAEVSREYQRFADAMYEDAMYLFFPNGRVPDSESEDGPLR